MKELMQLIMLGSYQTEDGRHVEIVEFINLAKGNLRYAVALRNRVEWQHPETIVNEDLNDNEIIEYNDQYIMVNGDQVEINQVNENH